MDTNYLDKFENQLHDLVAVYLLQKDGVDNVLPETHDMEEKWEKICMSYLPDGVREFADYPTVSLGWMMFIGMAGAKFWDEDWEMYSKFEDLYASVLAKGSGYDNMDEYICRDILKLNPEEEEKVSKLVADTATLVHKALIKENFEPATPEAFNAYVRSLHQLYYFGVAVELKRLGYHMTPIG